MTQKNQTILLNNNRRFVKERENIPSYNRTIFEFGHLSFSPSGYYTLPVY